MSLRIVVIVFQSSIVMVSLAATLLDQVISIALGLLQLVMISCWLLTGSYHHCISIFTLDGNYVGKYETRGTGRKQLDCPCGIDIDMYMASSLLLNILKIVYLFSIKMVSSYTAQRFGSRGSGHGQFSGPRGITISPIDDIYVCDTNNKRIQIFSVQL